MISHLQPDFQRLAKNDQAFVEDSKRESLGTCPHIHQVEQVFELAADCETTGLEESAWNAMVHSPILTMAFHSF